MEMFTVECVLRLKQKDVETELVCYPDSKIHIEAEKKGIKTIPIKASGYFHPLGILKLSRIIKCNKYDLVHTQASKDLWVLVPALKMFGSGIPLIMSKQVGSFIIKKDFLHQALYKRVSAAFAISNVIKKNLLETTNIPENRIFIVHNSVDVERFNPILIDQQKVRNEFNISEKSLVIGMLARFSHGKGHEEFLRAARELLHKYPHLIFMIAGEASRGEDQYAESIKRLARELLIEKNVIFTGFRSDTPEVLAAMDIFAFPSHSEAFGIALAEAMAIGKPSVCSNSDGVLDIAVDKVTSFLFKKQDYIDLKTKLDLLIASPELRSRFGEEARKRIVENFNTEHLTDKTITIYKTLSESNK